MCNCGVVLKAGVYVDVCMFMSIELAGQHPLNTVADKKNVAFSHQNNLFGLNKSNERMSRIYNRILNG